MGDGIGSGARLPRGVPDLALALVLHTHMPYVEGFGTWPFGEEWLWEAIATSYLPLLDVLDEHPGMVTVSATPVLLDQLEAPGALARCAAFLREVRPESHRRDLASTADPGEAAALEHSAAAYARAADALARRDLLADLAAHASWTSAATHAVLPLLATDAGARLQLETGVASHRRRCGGGWDGGLWLPECAHGPWLDPLLEQAGTRAVCVDLTDVLGAPRRPLRTRAGPLLVPLDRGVVELVWSDAGYPADPAYRDYHGYTEYRHNAWANDGTPYDPARALTRVGEHAEDFVARVRERAGLVVCALDTELLGHWWHEGPAWLAAVLEAAEARGLRVAPLDAALEDFAPVAAPAALPVTTWGRPRNLSTWSGPPVADLAWAARAAELRVVADRSVDSGTVRELLAVQASDWAFLETNALAGPYARERFSGHRERLESRLAGHARDPAELRHLAPDATPAALHAP
jgi:1,4-alpha-glucan branching enzyme